MSEAITRADVESVEADPHLAPRQRAAQLIEWADGATEFGPEVSARSLLASAAELTGMAGDREAQWDLLDRAETAQGTSAIDLRAYRAEVLLAIGSAEAARDRTDDLRRSRSANPFTCHYLAEVFEEHGDSTNAIRWFNIGLRQLEDLDPDGIESASRDLLLIGRRRVRNALGSAPDAYDEEAQAVQAIYAQEMDDGLR